MGQVPSHNADCKVVRLSMLSDIFTPVSHMSLGDLGELPRKLANFGACHTEAC